MTEYLDQIARITRDYFLYVGSNRSGERIFDSLRRGDRPFTLADARRSEWQKHRAPNWDEVECTYRAASASVSRAESAALVEN
jgi:hypothetical protein